MSHCHQPIVALSLSLSDMKIIQSSLRLATDVLLSHRTKHIHKKMHFIEEHIDQKTIKCVYCPTDDLIADIMTKSWQ